ncbi:sigma-54-dependent Fis family transcriptional regulator [Virgibacillus ihumii]|uniref:sigma-54-dependent Fis family transcriptional regulator n=1 Tax=Virgibacillus ihumii TaxID=2686091 RepID=UPI001FEC2707|nr:sigma-54-dependent Fis family transcriptional regulator [Virgibacillus ihumii]
MIQDFIRNENKIFEKDKMLTVEKWMVPNPHFVQIDSSYRQVAEILKEFNGECIPVVSKGMEPVGIVTSKQLLNYFLNEGKKDEPLLNSVFENKFEIVHLNDSIIEIRDQLYDFYMVVDSQNKLVGMLTRKEVLNGLTWYIQEVDQMEYSAEILNVILDSAYEGITVVDEEGLIVEFNDAYSRFMGIEKQDVIGRDVQEVIDNTNLHNTVKTGMPERGALQYIQGQAMIVHRIPIWKNDRVVGAIGMLIFEGVTELFKIYERLQQKTNQQFPKKKSTTVSEPRESDLVTLDQIIGVSETTSELKHIARKVAKTNATVLITGESGTGKEMYAQSIHHLSPFADGHFISVNCGAIPEHLFESELFGYEEGAFTGAKKGGKPGRFELAQNGTLFLDEIGEMPLLMQIKLLRILQEKKFERVGGTRKYKMNTRIIAATNRDLKKMVEAGNFREDLFYRINVIELPITPLRNRVKDIPPLVSHYLNAICNRYQIPVKQFTSEAMTAFIHYDWYGNIRELANVIEKLVVLVEERTIKLKHLPKYMVENNGTGNHQGSENANLIHNIKSVEQNKEKEIILSAMQKNKGNKSTTAKDLGIHRTTLYQKLKKYNLYH